MTDEDIISMIRAGGKAMDAGVKALYQSAAQHMLRFFVQRGMPAEEAKDVLQETIVKIVRSAASFNGDGTAKAWIWQIARNCLIDHQRKAGALASHETAWKDADSLEEPRGPEQDEQRACDIQCDPPSRACHSSVPRKTTTPTEK